MHGCQHHRTPAPNPLTPNNAGLSLLPSGFEPSPSNRFIPPWHTLVPTTCQWLSERGQSPGTAPLSLRFPHSQQDLCSALPPGCNLTLSGCCFLLAAPTVTSRVSPRAWSQQELPWEKEQIDIAALTSARHWKTELSRVSLSVDNT